MSEMTRTIDPARPVPQLTAGAVSVRTLAARVSPERQGAHRRERRNLTSRAELLRRIEVEYHEMPGLSLTLPQAQRLFESRGDICVRMLATLVDRAVLQRDPNGGDILDGHRP